MRKLRPANAAGQRDHPQIFWYSALPFGFIR
jgi:hypothetical protein